MENNGILKSFDLQDDLNPKIWKKNSKGSYTLSPEVREKLLEIAYEFIESLKVDVIVSDVHLTGSLVNFNWSQYSDFDLHIIADFNQFPKKSLPLYEELFKLKKTIFNSEQNIKIYGYDVEVFVQDENEKGHSAGIFSLISNDWLEKPKKEKFEVNKTILKKKIDQWTEKIDKVLESAQEEKDLEKSKKLVSNLKEKLKDYRKIGLEKGGEMSYENLVFKYLRRSGHIEKLFSFKKERLDKELSLKESLRKKPTTNPFILEVLKKLSRNKIFEEEIDDPKKADEVDADAQELYDNLESIDEPLSQQNRGEYSFQKKVESMQIGLVLLGFDLPVYGVDGLYGPETADAVKRFKDENDLNKPDDSDKTDDSDDSGEQEESFSRRNNNLLEVNTYGFDGTKEGGNNGDWDGTMEKTLAIADIARSCWEEFVPDQEFPGITSQKRGTQLTASGRRGDHWVGSADSYAVDLPVPYKNRKELGDKIFSCIMQKWNNGTFSNFKGGSWFSPKVDGYRYQFGWYSDSAHKDHIHVGVRKIDSSIPNTPSMDFGSGESPSGEGSQFTPEAADVMIKKLKEKNIKSEDIKPLVDQSKSNQQYDSSDISPTVIKGNVKLLSGFTTKQVENIEYLIDEMNENGITNPYTQIGILSVIGKETGYIPKSEYSYSTTGNYRLRQLFGSRLSKYTEEELNTLKKDDRNFFNVIYAKTVGNRGGEDGYNYRGRGFNQLTGIENYRTYGKMIGMGDELVNNPDLVNDREIAAKIAIAFFTKGKSASTIPEFNNKEAAAIYFADLNAGGSSRHRQPALDKSKNFEAIESV